MSTRTTSRNPPSSLSIHPPSPTAHLHSQGTTPTIPSFSNFPSPLSSPRRTGLNLPASPTYSTHSNLSTPAIPWLEHRSRAGSLDVPRERAWEGQPPPVPPKNEKRIAYGGPPSPHRGILSGKGGYAGAYDAKLVTSSLSQLPPLPPISPTPTSATSFAHAQQHLHPSSHTLSSSSSYASLPHANLSRPTPIHPTSSSSSVVVLPDGTAIPTEREIGSGRSVQETLAHSSPSSPWSLLTVHVLPLFAGGPLKTPIEDLNQLCHSHIINTSQRAAASRLVAVLTSDLREFIASGMLTLKAKFETLEESKIVNRAAEVWSFFWTQVLPYLEAVFLPFSQVRDLPSTSHASSSSSMTTQPIPVRHILLSGFLLHILLPLLPRLVPLIANQTELPLPQPTTPDLQRILQMSLVLATQAKYSTFIQSNENEKRDEEVRINVESLGKAVRWRMEAATRVTEERKSTNNHDTAFKSTPQRMSLQRGPSMNGAKYRRRGWRASENYSSTWGQPPSDPALPPNPSHLAQRRQNSNTDYLQAPEQRWGKPRLDEGDDDDDDTSTPGQSFAQTSGNPTRSTATSTLGGTFASSGVGTIRGESLASYGDSQRTPMAEQRDGYGVRRLLRDEESEVTPVVRDRRV